MFKKWPLISMTTSLQSWGRRKGERRPDYNDLVHFTKVIEEPPPVLARCFKNKNGSSKGCW